MNNCPHCHRRLISHISPRCNWCGKEIEDATYQAQADTDRAAFFAQQAIHDAQSLIRTEAMLATGRDPFGTGPIFGVLQNGQLRNGGLTKSTRKQMAAHEAALAAAQLNAQNSGPPPPTFGSALNTQAGQAPVNEQAAQDAAFEAAQQAQRAAAQRHTEPEQRPWYAANATSGKANQASTAPETQQSNPPGPQETTPEHTSNRFQTIEW